jgi:hypothetical protein
MKKLILLVVVITVNLSDCGSPDTAPPKLTANQQAAMKASLQAEEAKYHIKMGTN